MKRKVSFTSRLWRTAVDNLARVDYGLGASACGCCARWRAGALARAAKVVGTAAGSERPGPGRAGTCARRSAWKPLQYGAACARAAEQGRSGALCSSVCVPCFSFWVQASRRWSRTRCAVGGSSSSCSRAALARMLALCSTRATGAVEFFTFFEHFKACSNERAGVRRIALIKSYFSVRLWWSRLVSPRALGRI